MRPETDAVLNVSTSAQLAFVKKAGFVPPHQVRTVFQFLTLLSPQCGNCRIFLSFRFYVKSTLENLEVLKLPFYAILRALDFVNLVDFRLQKVRKLVLHNFSHFSRKRKTAVRKICREKWRAKNWRKRVQNVPKIAQIFALKSWPILHSRNLIALT